MAMPIRRGGIGSARRWEYTVMSDLVAPVVPAAFLALALFVSFMQAFIFALLTTMYIAMAVPHSDHEAH